MSNDIDQIRGRANAGGSYAMNGRLLLADVRTLLGEVDQLRVFLSESEAARAVMAGHAARAEAAEAEVERLRGVSTCVLSTTPENLARGIAGALAPLLAEARREAAEKAWGEAAQEGHDRGWMHGYGRNDVQMRNPYRAKADRADR